MVVVPADAFAAEVVSAVPDGAALSVFVTVVSSAVVSGPVLAVTVAEESSAGTASASCTGSMPASGLSTVAPLYVLEVLTPVVLGAGVAGLEAAGGRPSGFDTVAP